MRNSVNELFVEGTCNVFGVNVCVVFECYVCCPVVLVVCVLVRVLCSSRCLCFVCDPMVFDVFPPDICLVCVYEGGYIYV